jgi:hypothetical protein
VLEVPCLRCSAGGAVLEVHVLEVQALVVHLLGEPMCIDLGSVGTPWSSEKLWLGPCSGLEDRVQAS